MIKISNFEDENGIVMVGFELVEPDEILVSELKPEMVENIF